MNYQNWLDKNCQSLKGRVVAITGSTGGLGRELARFVCELGGSLIFLDRNENKSHEHKNLLLKEFPNAKIELVGLNLESLQSVKKASEQIGKIDFLILNAGIFNVPLKKLENGFNNIFVVNFLSQYYLSKLLLPKLKSSHDGKIVAIGSIAFKKAKFNIDDIDYSSCKSAQKIYGNSKRFLMFSLLKLCQKENIQFSLAHPGITKTNMTTNYNKAFKWLIQAGMSLLFHSKRKASLSAIYAMTNDCAQLSWVGPKYFEIWGKPKVQKLNVDENEVDKIFSVAENLTNITL